ncbi:MAG: 1-deoxy-D-xylulose-5-phosphate synthase [Clostridia bacterium]|nr:1-deoxy-D-xylulose-5-phosphate synthase [Clostridia bacterium]
MYELIEKIKSPKDLKNLKPSELEELCAQMRAFLVDTVSETGGHLAGNLGVVELTVALHRVLNMPYDKIIFDVGHQSYVHKILTGRKDKMNTIRQEGGLCGFCSPQESEYDASFTGHASVSLSTALGIAKARDLAGEKYNIAAVIGDGAFTGGLAYEAINNFADLNTPVLIILNDNEMSISENVGAFSTFLANVRTNPKYTSSKRKVTDAIHHIPGGGEWLYNSVHSVKNQLKNLITKGNFFEQMGITYLGPVNGHNIKDMEALFKRALALRETVLVHVITKKGKGYAPAEKMPQLYHGVSPFDKNGKITKTGGETYSSVFGKKLCSIAEENKKTVAITPAMIYGSSLIEFSKKFPDRFFDVGIAEGHAVTFASGMAEGGAVPVVAIYSTFMQRAYDNAVHDVAIGKNHVVFALDRAGLVEGDGATHQGIFDITYMSSIPNMVLLSPSSFSELEKMLDYAVNTHNGPIAIRYPKGSEECTADNGEFKLSKASVIKKGTEVTFAAEGRCVSLALRASEILEQRGISAEVIDVRTIKPMDFDTVFESAEKTGFLYTIEENVRRGGMGEMICSEAQRRGSKGRIFVHAINDEFVTHGTKSQLFEKYGYTDVWVADSVERMLKA